MNPASLLTGLFAFFLAGPPMSVEWLSGPHRDMLVCGQPGLCEVVAAAPDACPSRLTVHGQWSRSGAYTPGQDSSADFTVLVWSDVPLAAVSVVRPGSAAVAWTWGATGDGTTWARRAFTGIATTGVAEVSASDASGCAVRVRGRR